MHDLFQGYYPSDLCVAHNGVLASIDALSFGHAEFIQLVDLHPDHCAPRWGVRVGQTASSYVGAYMRDEQRLTMLMRIGEVKHWENACCHQHAVIDRA